MLGLTSVKAATQRESSTFQTKLPCARNHSLQAKNKATLSVRPYQLTFLTSLLISFVDQQVARALWEPGQDEELQERWDTCGGEQDGPVLFFTQELSVKSHRK